MSTYSETARKTLHIAMAAGAFLLPYLTAWQAAGLAAIGVGFNLWILPRVAGSVLRAGETRNARSGILLYPIAILILVVLFPARLDIVAVAWGILGAGDGMATLVGRALGGPRWPWHPRKHLTGTAAFIVCGGGLGVVLAWWMRYAAGIPLEPMQIIVVPLVAATMAGLAETLPIGVDDNVSVTAVAAAVVWAGTFLSATTVSSAWPQIVERLPYAVALNVAFAVAAAVRRTVSRSGTIVGAIVGVIVYTCVGAAGWLLLLACYLMAVVTSRLGAGRKRVLGIHEAREGRRGVGNVLGNCGLAAAAAVVFALGGRLDAAMLVFVTALVAGASDTAASEVGKAYGMRTYLLTTLERVSPGTSGALSAEGTAAGILAALALGGLAVAGQLMTASLLLPVVLGATIGAMIESALGATLEADGTLNNDVLNFLNTAVAAVAAAILARGSL